MKPETLTSCMELLDKQHGYIRHERTSRGKTRLVGTLSNQRQDAYYQGMMTMLEFILTEGYTQTGCIVKGIYHHRFDNTTDIPFESQLALKY